MDWGKLEQHFSTARLERYRICCGGNEQLAVATYACNMQLAEATMPMLHVIEVALRNGIDRRMGKLYQRSDWWEAWKDTRGFSWQIHEVSNAKAALQHRSEPLTVDKVIAELTFGFWSSLFNAQFQHLLWKELRLVFPRCPKIQRQRRTISSALNQIRYLRNRVFHHEPVLWLTPALPILHAKGLELIGWLDPDLLPWICQYDRFPAVWRTIHPNV